MEHTAKVEDLNETRLAQASAQENRVQEALRIASGEINALSYALAHDLRAPLSHITGFGELLLRSEGAIPDPEHREWLQIMVNGAHRMGEMIEALVDYSRINTATLRFEECSLEALLDEVLRGFVPLVPARELQIERQPLPTLRADRTLMLQLIRELLSNAFKFTQPRAQGFIHISSLEENGRILLHVKDNGVGFSMQHAGQLFTPFKRLHPQEQFTGRGIGLAQARRIVSRHGGRIWAEAAPDTGASFFVQLPSNSLDREATCAASAPASP